jgi:hypothetical protein
MKNRVTLLIMFLAFAISFANAQTDTLKKSIPKKATLKMGRAQLRVAYYAPSVRNRIIYGGLVPFDEVWVTGAHSATSIEFNVPVTIAGSAIAAGKYALFTIPGRDAWTVIINKNYKQHLTDDYDANEDIIRFTVVPRLVPLRERLDYHVEKTGEREVELMFRWETVGITFPILLNSNKPEFKMDQ